MIGQNFFNYVDFMINKVLLYVNQAKKLTDSELIRRNVLNAYSVDSHAWYCNYRERTNDLVIDNDFISTVKEKDQGWSEWKYGLPTGEVDGLEYIPREQPDLQFLGKKFNYNPKNKVFFIPDTGQSVADMARESIEINALKSKIDQSLFSSRELQKYLIFKSNKFIPNLGIEYISKFLGGRRYYEHATKNTEFYSEDDILLSKNFKFPRLRWGTNNKFLLYYNPFEDISLQQDYKFIKPSLLIAKVAVPRLFSRYDKEAEGNYSEVLFKYNFPDFDQNKVIVKDVKTDINKVNSCYIVSSDNSKIFEIVISRIFFRFSYKRLDNTITWRAEIELNNKFIGSKDKTLFSVFIKEENLDNLEPSRFNLNPVQFKRIDKSFLNSLALMEHSPETPLINYIEPFIYQPGTLPASTRWQSAQLDQTGGYPKGVTPTSVETDGNTIEYKFDFDINTSGGAFEKLPNPKNSSKYNFKKYNLVPTDKLIL